MEAVRNPHKLWSMFRDPWLLLAAACAILALITVVLSATVFGSKEKKQAAVVAPGFVLRDQEDRLTSLAQFRGKVVALTFIDPECTQICPLTTQSMVEALKLLGPAAAQVQLLGVNINPLKAQVADVAAYTRSHGLQNRFRFLTGSREQLESVWHSYQVYVTSENDEIEHEAVVFLIDGNGNERTSYRTPMSYAAVGDRAQTLAEGIAKLLPDQPSVSAGSQASQQEEEELKPAETVSLAALGPKRAPVILGGAHPHLMLFFAGWLGKGSALSKNLTTLDSYAALAQRQEWPSPVAVDELTTEPSPGDARQALAPLAATLRTPIVEDASGRLADSYLVGDLPWFVLSSSSGEILWSHGGWLSAADLSSQVRTVLTALTGPAGNTK
jgi:cytochrome oxidase Cu insertion factor (SCO1/SenC/PrrC family)